VFWCGPGAVAYDHLSPLDFWSFLHGLYPDWQPLAVVRHAEAFGLGPHLDRPLARLSTGTQRKSGWWPPCRPARRCGCWTSRSMPWTTRPPPTCRTSWPRQEERSALWLVASHEAPLPADSAPAQEWRLAP
jgi:hypothetical protein